MSEKQQEPPDKRLSRREFIRNTGFLGSAAIGTVLLAGLKPDPAKAAGNVISILPEWDYETDVLIVGTGMAGATAAIAAHQAGARVALLEKHPTNLGGNSIICGGNMEFGGTVVQKRLGVEDTVEAFYEDTMKLGNYRCNPELLRTFVDNGPDTVVWLESVGLKFVDALTPRPYDRAPRGHGMTGSGKGGMTVLLDWIKNAGIPILTGHKLLGIVREEQLAGRVRGAKVETPQGVKYFKARKGVIIASGGWKGNLEMRTAWDPRLTGELDTSGLPYVETTGEGILACQEIGAGLTDMSFVGEYRRKFGQKYYQAPSPRGLSIKDFNDVIFVNKVGKRFIDETVPEEEPFFEEVVNHNENKVIHVIFDSAAVERNKWVIDTTIMDEGYFFSAPTLAELAGKISVPSAALAQTVEKYNSFAAAGKDGDFGKPAPKSINRAPYYAVKMSIYCHDQGGGIRINTKSQVLDLWGKVIDGLYAAGEATGGYFGTTRGHGKISVHAVYGRIAGTNAAQ